MRTRLPMWSLCLGAITFAAFSLGASAQLTMSDINSRMGIESHVGNITGHAKAAKTDYRRYCVGCHGELGDGNGENFPWIDPKPRDFQLGIFKCRSTPTGTLPTDQDLFDTIARGLDRSNMPQWSTFTKQQRADLVAWVIKNLHADLSVEVLARRACMCPGHFSKVFKSVFGEPPSDFVQNLRLHEARRRLSKRQKTLRTVAASVGFSSSGSFHRAFERKFGSRPSSYLEGRQQTCVAASNGSHESQALEKIA